MRSLHRSAFFFFFFLFYLLLEYPNYPIWLCETQEKAFENSSFFFIFPLSLCIFNFWILTGAYHLLLGQYWRGYGAFYLFKLQSYFFINIFLKNVNLHSQTFKKLLRKTWKFWRWETYSFNYLIDFKVWRFILFVIVTVVFLHKPFVNKRKISR